MHYSRLLYHSFDYGIRIFRQMSFIKRYLRPKVDAACDKFGFRPSEKESFKVKFYYPLFNHVVNCENYLTIKGRRPTVEETIRLGFVSVWATLYDDLIDEEKLPRETLKAVFEKTLPFPERTPKMNVFMAMDDALKERFTPTPFYNDSLKAAIDWQLVSAKQLDPDISLAEILHISKEKCGNSSLLWASIMDENWDEGEKTFIYQSGFVGQLVNDAYDARKDILDGGFTYVRKSKDMAEAKSIFLDACVKLNADIRKCHAPEAHKKNTIERMAAIHAFGLVALDHLAAIDTKYHKPIDWDKVKRSDLVTDMDFWSKRFALLPAATYLAKL